VFSESLRDTTENAEHYWVKASEVKKIFQDTTVLRLYLGLVNEVAMLQYDNIKFTSTKSLVSIFNSDSVLNGYKKDYKAYRTYVLTMAKKAEDLDSMIADYHKPKNDSLALELYYKYFNASVDLMEYGLGFGKLPHVNMPHLVDSTKTYFEAAHLAADMFLDVNRRNYASAIINLIGLYDIVLKDSATLGGTTTTRQAAAVQNRSRIASEQRLLKYGTFMATVVQAKSSEEIENVIESFALPAGSARIKRESQFNVSLNAYCGLYTGYERINGVDKRWNGKFNSYGLTAPVGIAASWGGGCRNNNHLYHSSYSIFFSAVDIGALAAFRFANDTIAQVPNILLKDILSPGLFLSYGIPRVPISLNFGMQIGPNLRKVNSPNSTNPAGFNDYRDKMYYRYSVSVCVDIPVLNFYTNDGGQKDPFGKDKRTRLERRKGKIERKLKRL
jgi:hypothetical protein